MTPIPNCSMPTQMTKLIKLCNQAKYSMPIFCLVQKVLCYSVNLANNELYTQFSTSFTQSYIMFCCYFQYTTRQKSWFSLIHQHLLC